MAMAGSGVNEGVRALILETGCVEDSYRLNLRLLVVLRQKPIFVEVRLKSACVEESYHTF